MIYIRIHCEKIPTVKLANIHHLVCLPSLWSVRTLKFYPLSAMCFSATFSPVLRCYTLFSTVVTRLYNRSPDFIRLTTKSFYQPFPVSHSSQPLATTTLTLCFYRFACFWIPHKSDTVRYLSPFISLTSLGVMPSRVISVAGEDRISFFLIAQLYFIVYIHTTSSLPIHPSGDIISRHGAVRNNAAVNAGVPIMSLRQ